MLRGKLSLAAVVLAGLAFTSGAFAAFPPLRIVPPAVGGTTEEEPPDPVVTPCDPIVHQSPEPGTLALAAIGAGSFFAWKRRRSTTVA